MSVPGVSGGTMAILLGIYDRMISSVSHFFKDIKNNFFFLFKCCVGAVIGIGSLAFVIKWLLERFPIPVSFFFLGAVVGGIPALYKKTKETPLKISSGIYFLLGLIIVISIGFIPTGNLDFSNNTGITQLLMLLVTGIIIAIALVLPGISTSHMLLILGMYDTMLLAITKFNIIYLGILGFSVLIGVILITKPIEWTMKKFPHQTYCMIIGFVLGSTTEIFKYKILPAIPYNPYFGFWVKRILINPAEALLHIFGTDLGFWVGSIVISIVTFLLGIGAIYSLSKISND